MPKHILHRSIGVTLLLAAFLANPVFPAQEQPRHALVIGNGRYANSPLANPVNDANDMALALRKLGFQVDLRTDADQRTMEASIRAFGKTLLSGGVGLFYFAGHGIQVNGKNYLIPVGANIETEADVRYEAVDAGRVLAQMEQAENGMNIIILDACRNNPYARSFRSGETGLAKMDAPTGSILAFATAPGSVAADGNAGNGLYTSKLLVHMNDPGLKLEEVFKRVRIDVMHDSGNRQVPWESSSLIGDFYFNADRGLKVKSIPTEVKPMEPQKTASLTPAEIDHRPEERIKLAVLPFKAQYFDDSADNQKRALDSLIESTKAFQDVALTHSYYTYGKYTDGLKNITPLASAIDLKDKNRFWGKKWGNYRPDVGALKEFGLNSQVDLVFTCKVDCDGSQRTYCQSVTINAFLYDTQKDKLFQNKKSVYSKDVSDKRSTIFAYYTDDAFYLELKKLSAQLIQELLDNRKADAVLDNEGNKGGTSIKVAPTEGKKYRFAVFPFKANSFEKSGAFQKRAVDALIAATESCKRITLTHSYYDLADLDPQKYTIQKIDDLTHSDAANKIWESNWGHYDPNVDEIVKIASPRKIDLVFTCRVDCAAAGSYVYCPSLTISSFLYTIAGKRLFQTKERISSKQTTNRNAYISDYYATDEFYLELKNQATRLLKEFLDEP